MSERDAEMDLAMCSNATPGPWHTNHDYKYDYKYNDGIRVFGDKGEVTVAYQLYVRDAHFIIECREALPYWIQRAQGAEAEVERLKTEQREDMELMAESVDVEAFAIKAIKKLQNERDEARKEVEELKKELATLIYGK